MKRQRDFENLPTATAVGKPMPDGKFEISMPDQGGYVAVATSGGRLVNKWYASVEPLRK